MNNNLYHWHAEHAVRYEMHEIDRAVEQARLLQEAGLSAQGGPGWLMRVAHAVRGLGNLLKAPRNGLQDRRSIEPGIFREKSTRSV